MTTSAEFWGVSNGSVTGSRMGSLVMIATPLRRRPESSIRERDRADPRETPWYCRGSPLGKSVLLDEVARRTQGVVVARVADAESEMPGPDGSSASPYGGFPLSVGRARSRGVHQPSARLVRASSRRDLMSSFR